MRTALKHKFTLILMSGLLCPLVSFGQDSLNVRKVGELPVMQAAVDIAVRDTLIFVASNSTGLRIASTANPDTIVELGYVETPDRAVEVKLQGNYAYVADMLGGLRIIDISNPYAPFEAGFYMVGEFDPRDDPTFSHVELYDTLAFICGSFDGIHVLSISEPHRPQLVANPLSGGDALDAEIHENLLYVARGNLGLEVLDMTNPLFPVHLGWYQTNGFQAWRIEVRDSIAFVSDNDNVFILNVSNSAMPVFLSQLSPVAAENWRTLLDDNLLHTSSSRGIDTWNISDVSSPVWVRNWFVPSGYCCNNITMVGDLAYLSIGYDGVHIWNRGIEGVFTPQNSYNPISYVNDAVIVGDYAYIADLSAGFYGINISDSTNPRIDWLNSDGYGPRGVEADSHWLFALNQRNVVAYDISSPESPVPVGSNWIGTIQEHMKLLGDHLWLRDNNYDLHIINVANPPSGMGVTSTVHTTDGAFARYIDMNSDYVYSAHGNSAIVVWNNADPDHPLRVDTIAYVGSRIARLEVDGQYLYGISSSGDTHVFSLADPGSPEQVHTMVGLCGWDFKMHEDHAVLAGRYPFRLEVADFTVTTDPFVSGFYAIQQDLRSLELHREIALVSGYYLFQLFDISSALGNIILSPESVSAITSGDSLQFSWLHSPHATSYTLWSSNNPEQPHEFYTLELTTSDTSAVLPLPVDGLRVYFVTAE